MNRPVHAPCMIGYQSHNCRTSRCTGYRTECARKYRMLRLDANSGRQLTLGVGAPWNNRYMLIITKSEFISYLSRHLKDYLQQGLATAMNFQ